MKTSLIFASVLVSGLTAAVVSQAAPKAAPKPAPHAQASEPKTLECTYEAFNSRTGQALVDQPPVKMDCDDEAGATKMLKIGKFGTMDATAWQKDGKITVLAQKSDGLVSSVGQGSANLHMEIAGATYETVCTIK